jgi:hypothetical protein
VSAFFCVVLSCVGTDSATGRHPVQGVLPNVQKYIHKFQKSNSESEKARETNPNLSIIIYGVEKESLNRLRNVKIKRK